MREVRVAERNFKESYGEQILSGRRGAHRAQGWRLRAADAGTLRDLRSDGHFGLRLLLGLRREHSSHTDLRLLRREAEGLLRALLQSLREITHELTMK